MHNTKLQGLLINQDVLDDLGKQIGVRFIDPDRILARRYSLPRETRGHLERFHTSLSDDDNTEFLVESETDEEGQVKTYIFRRIHKLKKSNRIPERFAFDNPDGPTLSKGQSIILLVGRYQLEGKVDGYDEDSYCFVPDEGEYRLGYISLEIFMEVLDWECLIYRRLPNGDFVLSAE
ncbi:hypothetical protein [Ktedonobacter racemifer]|uniref:Uncharacterized protein n=1 Tax=Ktedonobacter racemifer DSM 44963 TaxID=485913 RepID=D6TKV5_KTERA|nr:hypothetical protein [Ktedonobacter racemifer]EFH86405.1 hypothetical protein Krac_7703 [Ktedonobacter racemifer DSM 44963]